MNYHKMNIKNNIDNAQRKYMKFLKKELVQPLILAKQYIAENNTKWVANHFEMFK